MLVFCFALIGYSSMSPHEIRLKITQEIVSSINRGNIPWRRPWQISANQGLPKNLFSKRRYTGINTLILYGVSLYNDYQSCFWSGSSSVLSKIGALLKKDEQPTFVTFFNVMPLIDPVTKKVIKDKAGKDKLVPLMKEFPVFNIQQFKSPTIQSLLVGKEVIQLLLGSKEKRRSVASLQDLQEIAKKYVPRFKDNNYSRIQIAKIIHDAIQKKLDSYLVLPNERSEISFEPADNLLKASGAKIKFGGTKASYTHKPIDLINLPNKTLFASMADFYQTAFHELSHWTQPNDRVGRTVKFEDKQEAYAFEELVAEMSACFLTAEIGVPMANEMLPNSKSYISVWIAKMKNDPKYIFAAASQATKIVDYLLSLTTPQVNYLEMVA